MKPREWRKPTHVLKVEVPLYLTEERDVDPVQTAIRIALSASHAAFEGNICADPEATITECDP